MNTLLKTLMFVILACVQLNCNSKAQNRVIEETNPTAIGITEAFSPWQEGYLDIHHINTGNGDCSFMVFPDGTTMLFDAGIIDKGKFEEKYAPLKATSTVPSDSLSAAAWIANYIKRMASEDSKAQIDYALVSHFHSDHYGSLPDLARMVPVRKIIDRNYPDLNFPFDLRKKLAEDEFFQNYLSLISNKKIAAEALDVGSDSQIYLVNDKRSYPNFKVRNVKSNATIWTGHNNETIEFFKATEMTDFYKGGYNENPLSLALKISYGKFDYFTGGDNTGLQGFGLPYWFDVETPMAKGVGKVEVVTLNHHSNRDATNEFFVRTLDPKVVVQQSWCSDHPGQEVYQRLIYKDDKMEERDIFATNMHPETLVTYGPWFKDNYKSMRGHIVIRVNPGGEKYKVFILNEATMQITQEYGPYSSK
ncbi:ComEC/Rec2 family competence protein [Spongiimicrobium sp. 3-5]|uniref:ComEC/Rec2 family competence protein n=1 Tax=Spongiimicrobium sp. 3-5 TaxID=3332596 RepID=UPI00397F4B38